MRFFARTVNYLGRPRVLDALLVLAIVVGVIFRVATVWTLPPRFDATAYMALGHSLAQGDGLAGPWGRFDDAFSSTTEATNLGPVYPLYLAVFYATFDFSVVVTQAAGLLLAVLVLLLAFVATRDLFGRRPALVTCAVLATHPVLIVFPGMEWSDNFPVLLAVLALWSLIKGIRSIKVAYFLVAGLAVALFALTKAQSLTPLLAAGAGGAYIAWRMIERGRGVLRDRCTWAFLLAFLVPMGLWFVWGPEVRPLPALAGRSPVEVVATFGAKLLFVAYSLLFTVAFLLPELWRARESWKTEEGRILWLAALGFPALVAVLLTAQVASGLTPWEPTWKLEQARHLLPVLPAFLWIARPGRSESSGSHIIGKSRTRQAVTAGLLGAVPLATWWGTFLDGVFFFAVAVAVHIPRYRPRVAVLLAVAVLVAANGSLAIDRGLDVQTGLWLETRLRPGDVVAVDPWSVYDGTRLGLAGPSYKYELYPYIGDRNVRVVPFEPGVNATYILSYRADAYPGYDLAATLYPASTPGPLSKLWNAFGEYGRNLLGPIEPVTPQPSAWILHRRS